MAENPEAATVENAAIATPGKDDQARLAELERYAILDTPTDGAFDDITALAASFFHVPIAGISLVDRDRIWFKSARGLGTVRQIERGPGLCAAAIMTDKVYVASDLQADPYASLNPLVGCDHGFRFYAGAPLHSANGHNLGTCCIIDMAPRAFTQEDEQMLARFGRLAMALLEQHRAKREAAKLLEDNRLEYEATHDPVTGLLNREAIQSRLQALCDNAPADQKVATLLFDIDHFKTVNVMHGDKAGDTVLAEVARRIQAAVRPDDCVGRFGDGEFLVMLPGCDRTPTARIAERIRHSLEFTPVHYNNIDIRITISAGIHIAVGKVGMETVLQAVHDAVEVAKVEGRNRVVFSLDREASNAAAFPSFA